MLGCRQSPRDVTTANLLKRKLVKNVVGLQKFDQELRVSYKPTAFRRWVVDAAQCMVWMYLNDYQIPTEHRNTMQVENKSSGKYSVVKKKTKSCSLKFEAHPL